MSFYAAAFLIVAGVALFVAAPLSGGLSGRRKKTGEDLQNEHWEHEHSLAVQGLRELEFDREMGKLADADYESLRGALLARALEAMTAQERIVQEKIARERTAQEKIAQEKIAQEKINDHERPTGLGHLAASLSALGARPRPRLTPVAAPAADDAAPPPPALARVATPEAFAGRRVSFCPQCGLRVPPASNFCGECGAALRGERVAVRAS